VSASRTAYQLLGKNIVDVHRIGKEHDGEGFIAYDVSEDGKSEMMDLIIGDRVTRILNTEIMVPTILKQREVYCVLAYRDFYMLELKNKTKKESPIHGVVTRERYELKSPAECDSMCVCLIDGYAFDVEQYKILGDLLVMGVYQDTFTSQRLIRTQSQLIVDTQRGAVTANLVESICGEKSVIITQKHLTLFTVDRVSIFDTNGMEEYRCLNPRELKIKDKYIYDKRRGFVIAAQEFQFREPASRGNRLMVVNDRGIYHKKGWLVKLKDRIKQQLSCRSAWAHKDSLDDIEEVNC
jgi:hypothetical protein